MHEFCDPKAKILKTFWITNFHINSRLSNLYRKNRVFLAGDAAHIHSPVGGQGMNTGFSDVFNLAWKLAWVHQKRANPLLLSTYEIERYQVGKALLKITERASFFATLHHPLLVWCRDHLMAYAANKPFIQKRLTQWISQIGIRYQKGSITYEDGSFPKHSLKVGLRAPDIRILYQKQEIMISSLWKGSTTFQMLIFCGSLAKDLFLDQFFTFNLTMVQTFLVSKLPLDSKKIPKEKIILDTDGSFHELYGIKNPTIYLIRPDLYVGYRQTPINFVKLNDYLSNILFV